jgi:hypothetical protein
VIEVTRKAGTDPLAFEVVIREGQSESRHQVTMSRAACDRLAGSEHDAEKCIEAAFRFLLDREPKESILGRFDVSVISRYFPEFERELPQYLEAIGISRSRGR